MCLIGIHESIQGSEIISIRINEIIIGRSHNTNSFGLGPDDIVVLQKCDSKVSLSKQNPVINIMEKKKRKIASILSQNKPKILSLSSQSTFINFLSSKIDLFNEEEDNEKTSNIVQQPISPYKLHVHSPGGLLLSSQASFAAYFSQLLQAVSKKETKRSFIVNKLLKLSKNGFVNTDANSHFISEGYFYSWNIFSEKDLIVTVDNPGGCTAIMINRNGEFEDELTISDWNEVSLSIKLRFFRCSQPILAFLMHSRPILAVCYYIYDVPIMSPEDFDFCMNRFAFQNDSFDFSIAMALIVNCDMKFVLEFFSKHDRQHPRILFHLINNISPSSKLCSLLFPILESHMLYFNDDIELATIFLEIAIANNHIDICKSLLLPLLKSSLWSSSNVAIVTARFFIKNDMINEALECINIASIIDKRLSSQMQAKKMEINKYPTNPIPKYENLDDVVSTKCEQNSLHSQSSTRTPIFTFFDSNKGNVEKNAMELKSILDLNLQADSNVDENLPLIKKRSFSDATPVTRIQKSRSNSLIIDSANHKPLLKRENPLFKKNESENNLQLLENSPKHSPLANLLTLHRDKKEEESNDVNWHDHNLNENSSDSFLEEEEIEEETPKIDLNEAYEFLSNRMTSPDDCDKYGPSQSSKLLLTKHFSSIKTKIALALTEIISRIGTRNFDQFTDHFLNRREIFHGQIQVDKYKDKQNPLDALINSTNADNEIELDHDQIHPTTSSNTIFKNQANIELKKEKVKIGNNHQQPTEPLQIDLSSTNLFDPGIETTFDDFMSLSEELFDSIPASHFFVESIKQIRSDYEENMMFLSLQKDITTSTQHAILFRSLVMRDTTLMEAILNSFNEKNKATGTDKLILLKGFTLNVTSHLETILTLPLEPLTVLEKNALAFMEPFAIGVHRLNNADI